MQAMIGCRWRPIHAHRATVSMLSVFTTVLWLVFAAAGVAGLMLGYPRMTVQKAMPPVTVERLNVNVVNTQPRGTPLVQAVPRQVLPDPMAAPLLPPLLPMADPKLNLPFPMALRSPTTMVTASKAVPSAPPLNPAGAKASSVQHLTFGQGEGDQPAPEYPREAKLAHEQGSVIVQMTIDESGEVTDAKITSPCPWPILNQAALRAVRDTWHFDRGPIRYKDIEFVFELRQQ